MSKRRASGEFADQVRMASRNFDASYAANAPRPWWLIREWREVRAYIKSISHNLYALLFLVLFVFGHVYADIRIASALTHEIDTAWKPVTHAPD